MLKNAMISLFILSSLPALSKPLYYSPETQEATFRVESYTFFGKANGEPTEDRIRKDVDGKVKYMLSFMYRNHQNSSALNSKYSVSILSIESANESLYRVKYAVNGKGAFKPGLRSYDFYIPITASTLYQKAQGRCLDADSANSGVVSSSNFWYHWHPLARKCPLQAGVDYVKYTAALNYISNTTKTYPEYERLYADGKLEMTIFYGLTDYTKTNWNPLTSNDWSAGLYRKKRQNLLNMGFSSKVISSSEVKNSLTAYSGQTPYVEMMSLQTSKGLIIINLVFSNTGYEHDSSGFHAYLRKAFLMSDAVIYNGHSGLGKNLKLELLESLRGYSYSFKNDYQIFFLGSCIPYSYYPDQFFSRKGGTKNLDIMAFGGESTADNTYDQFLVSALIRYGTKNIRLSYQEIIPKDAQFYLAINGDEDNPKQ